MLTHPCTRRRFMASASLAAAAGVIATMKFGPYMAGMPDDARRAIFISVERAPLADLSPRALLLDGPRIARLQTMAASLPGAAGEVILRLDATDDELLDIAAQQAGVSIRRGAALPDGAGVRAAIIPHQRSFG